MRFLASTLMTLLFALQVHASKPVKILHFTNDMDAATGAIFVTYDENKDVKMMAWRIDHEDGEVEKDNFSIADLRAGNVFKKGLLKKFVKIKSENFSAHNGGVITIQVPKNILIGTKTIEKVSFDRVGDNWELNNDEASGIRAMRLRVHRRLGVPLGVNSWSYTEADVIY